MYMLYNKDGTTEQWRKDDPFNKWCWCNCQYIPEKMKLDPYFIIYTK
jgi:hypothetical protein